MVARHLEENYEVKEALILIFSILLGCTNSSGRRSSFSRVPVTENCILRREGLPLLVPFGRSTDPAVCPWRAHLQGSSDFCSWVFADEGPFLPVAPSRRMLYKVEHSPWTTLQNLTMGLISCLLTSRRPRNAFPGRVLSRMQICVPSGFKVGSLHNRGVVLVRINT